MTSERKTMMHRIKQCVYPVIKSNCSLLNSQVKVRYSVTISWETGNSVLLVVFSFKYCFTALSNLLNGDYTYFVISDCSQLLCKNWAILSLFMSILQ